MCLHQCFEILTLKVRDIENNGYNRDEEDKQIYCDGSRDHGCNGCFCQQPDCSLPSTYTCLKCGKMMYDLLDALWKIRQEVYNRNMFKEKTGQQLFLIEYEIEDEFVEQCFTLCLTELERSDIIKKYTNIATEIRDRIIGKEEDAVLYDSITY